MTWTADYAGPLDGIEHDLHKDATGETLWHDYDPADQPANPRPQWPADKRCPWGAATSCGHCCTPKEAS